MQEKLLPNRADINKVPLIFSDTLGLPHRNQTRKTRDTIVKQTRLEHRGFHSLRHTHASNLIDAEIYPLAISKDWDTLQLLLLWIFTHTSSIERKRKWLAFWKVFKGDKRGKVLDKSKITHYRYENGDKRLSLISLIF